MSLNPNVKPALRIRLVTVVSACALLSQIVFIGPVRKAEAKAKPLFPNTSSPAEPFIVNTPPTFAATVISGVSSLLGFVTPTTVKKESPKTEESAVEPPSPASPVSSPMMATGSAFDLAQLRLSPKNATGGTDLYSRNFGWGTSLVGLPGRAGLDAGFGISYNSLVWIKDTTYSEIIFDPDLSNVSPGFKMGFPTIEAPYQDPITDAWRFLVVSPDGSRTEFKQDGSSANFYPGDSSYRKLYINDTESLEKNQEEIDITIVSTDGTKMHYLWNSGSYRCYEIKDRNGNYVSIDYNGYGRMTEITDTLGREITINYDGGGYPTTIQQTWKNSNGSGSNVTHTWATFDYTNVTVSTSFSGLTVVGPANSTTVKALEKITYPDGSFTKFEYNGYVQVKKISQVAADSGSHILNYVTTDLASVSGSQTDCPRFGETKTWVENFNGGSEVVVTNSLTTGASFSLPNSLSGTGKTRIDVAMTGHPDGLYTRTYVDPSGYKEGLPLATEDCTGSNCATRLRWTWTDWTQDNTGVSYITNPRVVESRVGDGTNVKKTTIGYGSNGYGLPEEVKVYDTDLSTVLKTQTTTYELGSTYTNRRIIGLPTETKLWQGTTSGTLMSKVTYAYDEGNLTGTDPVQNISPVQHDNTNYSSSFVTGRGLVTTVKRWDATDPTDSNDAVVTTMKYNTAGAVVSKTTPWDGTNTRTVKIDYTDNFNSSPGVTTYAYPKRVYDPAGNYSEIKYRYDIGANVEATSPAPAGQTYGKTSKRLFDSIGRLDKQSIYVNTTEKAYTRYEYPTNGIQSKTFSTVIDVSGSTSGPDTADEVLSESWFDGAGRVRGSRTEHPGSTGGWTATQTEYNVLGQVYRTSVPTEVSVSSPYDPSTWTAAGDDSTRGWIWNKAYYDWKGRTIRTVPSDSTGSDGKDTLISYAGCGCAGGQVTTVSGPVTTAVDVSGTTQTTKRRTQKAYEDILGRTYKTEIWDLDGAGMPSVGGAYSTVKTTFNGRDQATLIRQYQGSDSSGTYQDTTMSYDGHGRLYQSHKPEQRDGSNNLKYTTYTYNLDDTVATQTDGRGVVTSYTYNSRALVTNIAWNVGATGVTDPTDVTFSYDNVGNRTQMTDGLGQVDYSYSELSQMLDETRDFTDTLVDAPISGSKFKLEYTYNLSGGLKSYKDPYGKEINYTHDKTGRLSTVSGTSFGSVTSYAATPAYRAWGGLKHLDYSNGAEINMTYNDKLQAASFELKKSTTVLMKDNYEYHQSGEMKTVDNDVASKFDNLFKYDFAGRTKAARSAVEAGGSTETDLTQLPFRQDFGYDAFNHMTEFEGTRWTDVEDEPHTYTNNRKTGGTYDDDGRDISSRSIDAAGAVIWQYGANDVASTRYYQGDGQEIKRGYSYYDAELEEMTEPKHAYFIHSSVLNTVISEANETGKKTQTFVLAEGAIVALQKIAYPSVTEYVIWEHRDAGDTQVAYTDASGAPAGGVGWSAGNYDAIGRQTGSMAFVNPAPAQKPISPFFESPEQLGSGLGCQQTVDGILQPCGMTTADSATQCPSNNCGPIRVRYNGKNVFAFFNAYADGYSGYVPRNANYVGEGLIAPNGPSVAGRYRRRDTNLSALNRADNENDLRFSGGIQGLFSWKRNWYGFDVTFKDTQSARKLLEDTLAADPDCAAAFSRIFKEMERVSEGRNPLVSDNILTVFDSIVAQTEGGFRFDSTDAQAAVEYKRTTGFIDNVSGGGGSSWRTRTGVAYVNVFAGSSELKGSRDANHVMNQMFMRLGHEIAHVATKLGTYDHTAEKGYTNAFTKAANNLKATDFDSYITANCMPIKGAQ